MFFLNIYPLKMDKNDDDLLQQLINENNIKSDGI